MISGLGREVLLDLGIADGIGKKNHTKWDFKLRHDLNRIAYLSYALRRYIVRKSFKMEDENQWKGLEIHPAQVGAVR